ncbi:hypothetical protein GFS03_04725 [Sulfolobus sp. E5-1-F]|uniref:HD domain-containing protein n=1 Tax=Saccharolobus sp. E5-1-F TaxID=2663019 RepID=UPI0012960BE0|nr:HD domain-containing protein [Sulfolobus sp. E5-1-F]QGA53928.1 hypothetical protein GFS03_04725 [Sulfolobus sp. E5-1-F]
MACLAYYPNDNKNEKEELYEVHATDVVNYMRDNWFFEKLVNVISRRANLDKDEVHDLILLSGFLHDLGKIDTRYQEKPTGHYTDHELISARIILLATRISWDDMEPTNITKSEKNKMIGVMLIRPVLLHHYAKRDYSEVFRNINKNIKFQPYEECLDVITRMDVSFLRSELGREIVDKINNLLIKKKEIIVTVDKRMLPIDMKYSFYRFISASVLSLLNEADGRVAIKNRNSKPRR